MVIFNRDGIRVRQHPFINYYQVEQWGYGDCCRSYGQSWNYRTVFESTDIEKVQQKVLELLNENK